MVSLNHIENEIREIKQRNKRVELDKAWETSKTRILIISVMTYIIIALFLRAAQVHYPWTNAIVPTLAFAISTFTLPLFRGWWVRKKKKK